MQCAASRPLWQAQMADSVRDLGELLRLLGLDDKDLPTLQEAQRDFPLRVPRYYVRRMTAQNPKDPLLLQILPQRAETASEGLTDPLGEIRRQPVPGLIHKYEGRVLWLLTGACALHCRYCFRRQLPYASMTAGPKSADVLFAWLEQHPKVGEVILSGGDPLSLPDESLAELAGRLEGLQQLHTLRLHSRLPIALPSRVDERLLDWLTGCRLDTVLVLHLNHPDELDEEVAAAFRRLTEAGVRLYSQSVLLAGINDSAASLQRLFDRLWQLRVQPYYLHLLDPVRGAAHFDVPEWRGRLIYGELCARMAGYRLPRLVRETPGLPAKSLIPPMFATTC